MKSKLILLFCISLLLACSSSVQSVRKIDYSYLYDSDQTLIKPKLKIFHHSIDSSTAYFQINSSDALYSKEPLDTVFQSRVSVKYKLYASKEKESLLDSSTFSFFHIGKNGSDLILQASFKFKLGQRKGVLELRVRDWNRDLNIKEDYLVNKQDFANEQFFIFKEGGKALIDNSFSNVSLERTIEKSSLIKDSIFLLAGLAKSNIPLPPFTMEKNSVSDFTYDTIQEVVFNSKMSVNFTRPRMLLLSMDSAAIISTQLKKNNFPNLRSFEDLKEPIRYISTRSEFKSVLDNGKSGLDAFWLKLGKNENKAKKIIAKYYTRVEDANKYFSSYKEGWKTDRGIVYIVYGTPTKVVKGVGTETWLYGEENSILSTNFRFVRGKININANEMHLIRQTDYRSSWYRAVDAWRLGRNF